ncbi:hypothetical protein BDN72DRAFT_959564 [Pluteus cervinus]|uniref:Uncharacterized protein n=1 Tax=Pluteus cervinus TaxID=181527 RepID=A0ACD3AUT0_9AGAR|nr:hypothetical protein BDN72DRAFT_959564 [Pluteus cervinus]
MLNLEPEDIEPAFPPEIEEFIFSLCAQGGLDNCKPLIFVARRVYHWLRPYLYKVVIFHEDRRHYGPRLDGKSLKIHGSYIRHILLWGVISEEQCLHDPATCLSWCPNVVDVALWDSDISYDQTLINQLLALPLTHLSFDVTVFHSHLTRYSTSKSASFTSVTHLDLIGAEVKLRVSKIKEYFPSLTHLAINEKRRLSAQVILDCWGDQLEVLIWYINRSQADPAHSVPDDPRVAVIYQVWEYVREWNKATEDGPKSIWRIAEAKVEGRRRR